MRCVLLSFLLFLLCPAAAVAQAAPAGIRFEFDSAAVQDFLRAVDRTPLEDAELAAIVARPGAVGMVRNTIKYLPDSPRDGYRAALREIAAGGALTSDPYQLADAVRTAATIRALVAAVERDKAAMGGRIARRLAPHWPGQPELTIRVRLVVGGVSDGFVLDGDTSPQFFVALDKAGGDIAGLEQNIAHESVHVLQRQLALRHCPMRPTGEQLPVEARFLQDVYLEGVANYIADPADVSGTGEYIDMWRQRYARNGTPARMRENAWLFDALLAGLRGGELSWETASKIGFYGSMESRLYFHGRELARKHALADARLLSPGFTCKPEAFFGMPEVGSAPHSPT